MRIAQLCGIDLICKTSCLHWLGINYALEILVSCLIATPFETKKGYSRTRQNTRPNPQTVKNRSNPLTPAAFTVLDYIPTHKERLYIENL